VSLNVSCFSQYGTVEVRQHEATLDAEEIMSWIAYGQAIIDAALNASDRYRPTDTDNLIDTLPIPTSRERRLTAPNIRKRLKAKAAQRGTFGYR
jgi:gamma-glutamyl:cysteine ligase YbdK (ATP-grasp superfamily)